MGELTLIIPKSHPFATKKQKSINKDELYHLNFITLNPNSTIRKFIDNILIQNHIELKTIEIIKIENIKITRTLSIITNPECYQSKAFEFFYNELCALKTIQTS